MFNLLTTEYWGKLLGKCQTCVESEFIHSFIYRIKCYAANPSHVLCTEDRVMIDKASSFWGSVLATDWTRAVCQALLGALHMRAWYMWAGGGSPGRGEGGSVFISQGHYNKPPHVLWLKTIEMFSLTVLEAGSPKSGGQLGHVSCWDSRRHFSF